MMPYDVPRSDKIRSISPANRLQNPVSYRIPSSLAPCPKCPSLQWQTPLVCIRLLVFMFCFMLIIRGLPNQVLCGCVYPGILYYLNICMRDSVGGQP